MPGWKSRAAKLCARFEAQIDEIASARTAADRIAAMDKMIDLIRLSATRGSALVAFSRKLRARMTGSIQRQEEIETDLAMISRIVSDKLAGRPRPRPTEIVLRDTNRKTVVSAVSVSRAEI
jgi:hypothetical protein